MMGKGIKFQLSMLLMLLAAAVSGCAKTESPIQTLQTPFSTAVIKTPFQPATWTPAPTATLTPTPLPNSIWLDPALPAALRSQITVPADFGYAPGPADATLRIEVSAEEPVGIWIYALAAPFPTIQDGVKAEDLRAVWQGKMIHLMESPPLLMSETTMKAISALWGTPAPGAVQITEAEKLSHLAWERRPSWVIIPFEELNPTWKVLAVDGISPIQKGFIPSDYALTMPISVIGGAPGWLQIPNSNRDPDKLTTLAMTGVTALVRATAFTMEIRDITYPGLDVGPWLREADITHISNEVAFARNCPYPDPVQVGVKFCSPPRYIELLEDVGTDIVELSGDHLSDWGAEAVLTTLKLYDQRGWLYYGGGETLNEGRQAVIIEHNGNRLAFIGCNAKGSSFAHASANNPGAATCDFNWMAAEITRLRGEGLIPIATFQHFEYYTYAAQPNQIRDAGKLSQAGAVIVSGSQAHQPQGFEVSAESFVHHGLGNLFFDQYNLRPDTEKAFIDRHIFYDGRHISTELLTILFIDYARARPMTGEERAVLLDAVFNASGW
ncbi:MAG: CapA family protein [Chloroflexota bacterium]